jgi:hypothetical protein
MPGTFTARQALWHILGKDLAESIIADMGVKKASGKRLDHIDLWFLDLLDHEANKLSDVGWRNAKQQFKRRYRRHIASLR